MFWRIVWRSLRVRWRRASVVFAALAVAAAIVCAMSAVYFDIRNQMSRELRAFGANFFIGPAGGGAFWESAFQSVVRQAPPGMVLTASPFLYGSARTELAPVALAGVDFPSLRDLNSFWQVRGGWIGVNFDDRNAMIGCRLAERLSVKVGDAVMLVSDRERKTLTIKGIIEAGDTADNVLFVNLALAQQWLGRDGKISLAMLRVDDSAGLADSWAGQIRAEHSTLDARPIRQISASEGAVLGKIKSLMGLVALVILVLATLCVNTTLVATVAERAPEFALQKALGSRNSGIVAQILAETAVIVAAAVLAGCLAGYPLSKLFGEAVFSASITFQPIVLPLTAAVCLGVTTVAAILPSQRARRIEPARILKGD